MPCPRGIYPIHTASHGVQYDPCEALTWSWSVVSTVLRSLVIRQAGAAAEVD
jgi:hypothetical protein